MHRKDQRANRLPPWIMSGTALISILAAGEIHLSRSYLSNRADQRSVPDNAHSDLGKLTLASKRPDAFNSDKFAMINPLLGNGTQRVTPPGTVRSKLRASDHRVLSQSVRSERAPGGIGKSRGERALASLDHRELFPDRPVGGQDAAEAPGQLRIALPGAVAGTTPTTAGDVVLAATGDHPDGSRVTEVQHPSAPLNTRGNDLPHRHAVSLRHGSALRPEHSASAILARSAGGESVKPVESGKTVAFGWPSTRQALSRRAQASDSQPSLTPPRVVHPLRENHVAIAVQVGQATTSRDAKTIAVAPPAPAGLRQVRPMRNTSASDKSAIIHPAFNSRTQGSVPSGTVLNTVRPHGLLAQDSVRKDRKASASSGKVRHATALASIEQGELFPDHSVARQTALEAPVQLTIAQPSAVAGPVRTTAGGVVLATASDQAATSSAIALQQPSAPLNAHGDELAHPREISSIHAPASPPEQLSSTPSAKSADPGNVNPVGSGKIVAFNLALGRQALPRRARDSHEHASLAPPRVLHPLRQDHMPMAAQVGPAKTSRDAMVIAIALPEAQQANSMRNTPASDKSPLIHPTFGNGTQRAVPSGTAQSTLLTTAGDRPGTLSAIGVPHPSAPSKAHDHPLIHRREFSLLHDPARPEQLSSALPAHSADPQSAMPVGAGKMVAFNSPLTPKAVPRRERASDDQASLAPSQVLRPLREVHVATTAQVGRATTSRDAKTIAVAAPAPARTPHVQSRPNPSASDRLAIIHPTFGNSIQPAVPPGTVHSTLQASAHEALAQDEFREVRKASARSDTARHATKLATVEQGELFPDHPVGRQKAVEPPVQLTIAQPITAAKPTRTTAGDVVLVATGDQPAGHASKILSGLTSRPVELRIASRSLGEMKTSTALRSGSNSARTDTVTSSARLVADAVQEGRTYLDRNENGLAIEAFQRALSYGPRVTAVAAINGLGVAFARLGRYELAQHFFAEAMSLDPSNPRYAANLDQLTRSPAFAMRHDGDIAASAVASANQENTSRVATAPVQRTRAQLTRVSNHEYRLETVSPMAAPAAQVAARELHDTTTATSHGQEVVSANERAKTTKAEVDNPFAQ